MQGERMIDVNEQNPDLIVNKLFIWFIFFKCSEEAHNVGILGFDKVP
jgi:hypothetical protein